MSEMPKARAQTADRSLSRGLDAGHVRRGMQFLINIGVPLLVGVVRGEAQVALPAVIAGMAFGFADSGGPLLSRLRSLALDALCIALGAVLGWRATMRRCWCRSSSASPLASVWRR
jgi:hypothetical protein